MRAEWFSSDLPLIKMFALFFVYFSLFYYPYGFLLNFCFKKSPSWIKMKIQNPNKKKGDVRFYNLATLYYDGFAFNSTSCIESKFVVNVTLIVLH